MEEPFRAIPILHSGYFCLSKPDLPIDLPDVAEIGEIRIVD